MRLMFILRVDGPRCTLQAVPVLRSALIDTPVHELTIDRSTPPNSSKHLAQSDSTQPPPEPPQEPFAESPRRLREGRPSDTKSCTCRKRSK